MKQKLDANFIEEKIKKECPKCKGKCEFLGFKNDRLHYRCKRCKKRRTKSKDGIIKKFPGIYKLWNDDLKLHYPIKKPFTANQI